MKIKLLRKCAFEISKPRLGYWIDIAPLRFAENEKLFFAICANDLNGSLTNRQSFLLSKEFTSRNDAAFAWCTGFELANFPEHFQVGELTAELLAEEYAVLIDENGNDLGLSITKFTSITACCPVAVPRYTSPLSGVWPVLAQRCGPEW